MSIVKYVGEQNKDQHGGDLSWPGLYELPMRGNVGLLKNDELDEFYEVTQDFHSKEFDMANAEHTKEYNTIMDRVVNGWYTKHFVEHFRDKDGKHLIYIEWSQSYGQINPKANARIQEAHTTTVKRVS